MNIDKTNLEGVLVISSNVHSDERGFFKETYQKEIFKEAGVDYEFVQDNHSRSSKGVLRGLHFQRNNPQGKLVRCSYGTVFDVAVDINPDSKTYGQYFGVELSDSNHLQLWIPPGYAHGFCVVSEIADFHYKCTDFYNPNDEGGLLWKDPTVNIDWPINNPIVSKKDNSNKLLRELLL